MLRQVSLSKAWITVYLLAFFASFTMSIQGQSAPQCNATLTASPSEVVDGCGSVLTCNTGNDGNCNPIGYTWEWSCTANQTTCNTSPNFNGATPTGPQSSFNFSVPGSYTMVCRVDWRPPYYGAAQPRQTPTATQVEVSPPNGQRIIAGLNNPTPPTKTPDLVQYQLTGGGQDCCPYAVGSVQEIITRGGVSTTGKQNSDYSYTPAIINDNKVYALLDYQSQMNFSNYPDGYVLDDFTQENDFIYQDCCGNSYTVSLGTFHFQKQKSGDGWVLVQL